MSNRPELGRLYYFVGGEPRFDNKILLQECPIQKVSVLVHVVKGGQ